MSQPSPRGPIASFFKGLVRLLTLAVVLAAGLGIWYAVDVERRQKLDGAMQAVRDGAQGATATVRGKVDDMKATANMSALEAKVSGRLHDDATLAGEEIEVSVPKEGTVILKGLVLDADSKEKAVELARETRGVRKVVDHLAITPPTRVFGTAEATGDATRREER